ncbi:MAG: DUF2877 domain-containing protein [Clostridia bacterium]|nr:DUF2877 domain-containing protein [Clostridia bacterium]
MVIPAAAPESIKKYVSHGDRLVICGVFSSAVYMKNPRGEIVLLCDEKYGLVPFGAGLKDAEKLIAGGSFLVGSAGVMTCGKIALGGMSFSIEFKPEPEERRGPPEGEALAEAVEKGAERLIASKKGALWNGDDIFTRASERPRQALLKALKENDAEASNAALMRLLGLGSGLTPSLDDYISSLCHCLVWARDVWQLELPEAETLCRTVERLAPVRTSEISAAYLLSAAAGERPQRISDALRSLLDTGPADRLLEVGGGSGGDMLSGLLAGMDYLLEKPFYAMLGKPKKDARIITE